MKARTKKLLSIIACGCILCACLSGCSSAQREDETGKQIVEMSVAVAADAPDSVKMAADEFINRAAYYSDGELEFTLVETEEQDSLLAASQSEFAFVLNESLVEDIPELKTLELPFFFKHADYQFSALNSERTRKRLNELIAKKYPMELQMASACGYDDYAVRAEVDLTDYIKRYPIAVKENYFSDELQQDINAYEIVVDDPMQALINSQAEIARAELSQVIEAVEQNKGEFAVLDSGQRIRTVYLLKSVELNERLTAKQQAAVEQAAVMACGYCRTVSDRKREDELEKLRELGVRIEPVNLEKYYAMMGDIYQDEADRMLYRPDTELDRVIRSDAVRETF